MLKDKDEGMFSQDNNLDFRIDKLSFFLWFEPDFWLK